MKFLLFLNTNTTTIANRIKNPPIVDVNETESEEPIFLVLIEVELVDSDSIVELGEVLVVTEEDDKEGEVK